MPGFLGSFGLADLEVDLDAGRFTLGAAEAGVPSVHATAAGQGSFRGGDCLLGSFLECPVPLRTRRAFSRARSSNSISSFSPGEVSVAAEIEACKHVVSYLT